MRLFRGFRSHANLITRSRLARDRTGRATRTCLCAAACAAIAASTLQATTYTWTGGGADSNWSNSANWSGAIVPVSNPATDLVFTGTTHTNPNQDIRNNFQVQSLSFSGAKWTLGGFSISMDGNAVIQSIAQVDAIVNNDIALLANTTVTGAGSTFLNGIISDAGGIIKNGPGTLILSGANTYTGSTQINSGHVSPNNGAVLKSSTVSINVNGGLDVGNLTSVTLGNLTGNGNWNLNNANVLIGNNNSTALPYLGTITAGATGGLQKVGTGTLTLGGVNSSFYDFAIKSGELVLDGGSLTLTSASIRSLALASSMTMQNGAQLDTRAGTGEIGGSFSDDATMMLSGPTTRWRAGLINVGTGRGSLIVDAGAKITDAVSISIGRQVSNFTTQTPATLFIGGQGSVTVDTAKVGNISGSRGLATVTGNGSLWTINSSLVLGRLALPPTVSTGIGEVIVSLGGAIAVNGNTNIITPDSSIEVIGGTFSTGSLTGNVGLVELGDSISPGVLAITGSSGTATYSGAVSGSGGLVKSGASTHIFDGSLTYTGTTTVNGGTLWLVPGASRTFIVNGGTLQVPYSDFGTRSFKANPGGTILYQTNSISGGFLRGGGFHDLSTVTRLEGTTIGSDVSIDQSSPITMINTTNAGTLNSTAPLTLDGFLLTSAGKLNVNAAATVEAFESNGQLTVNSEGIVNNTGNDMVLGAGSRTFIGAVKAEGGTLQLRDRTTLQLNGALLVNNGTIEGPTSVNFGSVAKGSGRYGEVNVTDGGKFSPGNSPGTVTTGSTTWNSGGSYLVEIGDALQDFWVVDGLLKIDAPGKPFVISLASMDGLQFDNTRDYTWPILHSNLAIDGSNLALDISGFRSELGAGHFELQATANDLAIHFSSVPEPAALALLSTCGLVSLRRRRSVN